MKYSKLMANPLNLGFAVIRDKEFEISKEDLNRPEVKNALKQGLIKEVKETEEVKPPKTKTRNKKDDIEN